MNGGTIGRIVVLAAALSCSGCIEQNPDWLPSLDTGDADGTSASNTSASGTVGTGTASTAGTAGSSDGSASSTATSDGSTTGVDSTASMTDDGTTTESSSGGSESMGIPVCPAGTITWSFDACPDGWTVEKAVPEAVGEPTWECGEAVDGPGPDGHPGVWATGLAGTYGGRESSALISPSFDLSDCTSAALTFEHFWEFEGGGGNNDGGILEVSIDGGESWMYVSPEVGGYFMDSVLDASYPPVVGQFGWSSAPGAEFFVWTTSELDLTPFVGNAAVRVRFVLGTDPLVQNSGWVIDDVEVGGT